MPRSDNLAYSRRLEPSRPSGHAGSNPALGVIILNKPSFPLFMGKIYLFFIAVIILASSAYAANINQLTDQHNKVLSSFTIFNSNQFNTYYVQDSTPSGHDQLIQIWSDTSDLRKYRILRDYDREQDLEALEEKTKNWHAVIEDDHFYGFDEELYGRKEFYLYWS